MMQQNQRPQGDITDRVMTEFELNAIAADANVSTADAIRQYANMQRPIVILHPKYGVEFCTDYMK